MSRNLEEEIVLLGRLLRAKELQAYSMSDEYDLNKIAEEKGYRIRHCRSYQVRKMIPDSDFYIVIEEPFEFYQLEKLKK